jgi:uncharacterized membrane protein YkoI
MSPTSPQPVIRHRATEGPAAKALCPFAGRLHFLRMAMALDAHLFGSNTPRKMKNESLALVAAVGLMAVFACIPATPASAKTKAGPEASPAAAGANDARKPVGSIRPSGKLTATGRLALAKISFPQAFNLALAKRPGKVVYGELEVDDGNLNFDFLIVRPDNTVTEVQIDAGNGRVLAVDDDADDS